MRILTLGGAGPAPAGPPCGEIAAGLRHKTAKVSPEAAAAAAARVGAPAPAAGPAGRAAGVGTSAVLRARTLPTVLLYDEAGLRLFDRITTDAADEARRAGEGGGGGPRAARGAARARAASRGGARGRRGPTRGAPL